MFTQFKQFVGRHDLPNDFYEVSEQDITFAENSLGYRLPNQLRAFYQEIGSGFYKVGTSDQKRNPGIINRIVPPREIPEILHSPDYPFRPYEGFHKDVMPFFDCGSGTFLVLKPLSNEPNAVYWPSGLESQRISKDLEEFFRRLYERADFYRHDVLESGRDSAVVVQ